MILQPPWVNSELQLHIILVCAFITIVIVFGYEKRNVQFYGTLQKTGLSISCMKIHQKPPLLWTTSSLHDITRSRFFCMLLPLYAATLLCKKNYHDHLTLFVFWSNVLQLYLKLAGFLSIQIGFDNFGGLQDITRSCFLSVCSYLPLYATTLLCKHNFLSWSPDPYNVTSVSLKRIHICYRIQFIDWGVLMFTLEKF